MSIQRLTLALSLASLALLALLGALLHAEMPDLVVLAVGGLTLALVGVNLSLLVSILVDQMRQS